MIAVGRGFDDGTWSWDDLHAFIFAAPPGTAVFHAVELGWTVTDHLLASVLDALVISNWQRTEDATKRPPRNVPKPFPRPGAEKRTPRVGDVVSVAGTPATVTTVGEYLQRRAQRQQQWIERHQRGGAA